MSDAFRATVMGFYTTVLQWHREAAVSGPHFVVEREGQEIVPPAPREAAASGPGSFSEHYDAMISVTEGNQPKGALNQAVAIIDQVVVDARWRHELKDQCDLWFRRGFHLIHPERPGPPVSAHAIAKWGGDGVALARDVADANVGKPHIPPDTPPTTRPPALPRKSKPKRRGQPPLDIAESRKRQGILRIYKAKPAGQSRKDFCDANMEHFPDFGDANKELLPNLRWKYLQKCLAWERARKSRARTK